MSRSVWVLVLVGAAGCGSSPADDVGVDATAVDAMSVVDAFVADAGALPSDANIGADAPVLDPCDRAGATEIRSCGNCGQASFRCESGVWAIQTPCLEEGECSAGTFETETNATCGQRTRLCSAMCGWGAWSDTRPDGECVAGARRVGDGTCPSPTDAEFETCDATCRWNTTGVCEDADGCRGTPRRTPAWSEEVCVRAGTFIRDPFMTEGRPTAEISMSAFFIDRYTVTYGRYLECYRAGACPREFLEEATLTSVASAERVIPFVSSSMADAFCLWDGGRVVPTEAQWEYAARGPAPRMNGAPWEGSYRPSPGDPSYCSFIGGGGSDCDFGVFDHMPGTRSYFGVERQVWTNTRELMRDWFSPTWIGDPRSTRRDPYQSVVPPGNERIVRAGAGAVMVEDLIGARSAANTGGSFRCARPDTL